MLFNSVEFALFLPLVFLLYWFVFNKTLQIQNAFIVVASYVFYGWWDWRFLFLIATSSLIDYTIGLKMRATDNQRDRKILLIISIVANIGFLGFFKYNNFFLESFASAFTLLGTPFEPSRLNLVIPIGISFYTLQTLSYSIDVYRKKLEPTNDIISFFAFVSFFPQLVAGPIERAVNLLPQMKRRRIFKYEDGAEGMRQILWGLFKKIVVADNCAVYVTEVFSNYELYSGSTLLLGAVLYSIQLYADFSGYSDIAIGTARLFGFSLMQNFRYPYFATNIIDFWRRWHISFSTWLREYIYFPLGGSKSSLQVTIRNVFIVFFVSSLWHGVEFKFVVWGMANALLFSIVLLVGQYKLSVHKSLEYPNLFFKMVWVLVLISLVRFFYRADSFESAMEMFKVVFSLSLFTMPSLIPIEALFFIGILMIVEWLYRNTLHVFSDSLYQMSNTLRRLGYLATLYLIIVQDTATQVFIYFDF